MRRSVRIVAGCTALVTAIAGAARAEAGLVEWIAGQGSPAGQGALRAIRGGKEWVQVRWRTVGVKEWEGELGAWEAVGKGLRAEGKGDGLLKAVVTAEGWRGGLRLKVTMAATRATTQPTEVFVGCGFEPAEWERQFFPRLPYLVQAPEAPTMMRFAADANDATTPADAPRSAFYPFGVLESDRVFVLWGSPDVGRFAVISPNLVAPSAPGFSLRPKRLAAGQGLTFDLVLKRFDKPQCRYRDVLRWYLRSAESSDPLVRDLFPWDGRRRARRFPVGNLGSGMGRMGEPQTPEARLLDDLRKRRVAGLWFQGWNAWDETYPTEGEWFNEYWTRFSADQMRDEIAWQRRNGLFPLLYCRQFLTEQGLHDDRPPFRDWIGRDQDGNRQAWGDYPVPEKAAAQVGFPVLQQSCADFGNDAYRAWYEERVKACLEEYEPAGIAWDMGWGAGDTWGYSRGNPRTPNGDGMLRAQADLWGWLHAHHPEMRTISNEAFGTPSQMFSDGILIEGGFAVGKTELDYEAAKALGTTVISYEYPQQYAARLRGLPTQQARYVQMRYRAIGVNTNSGRYVVYPSQEIVGKEGPAIACSDLVADGQWHVATYDMRGLPNVEEIKGLAFGMESGAEEAHLWVDYLRFSATPDGPPLAAGPDSFPSSVTSAQAGAFEARPGWLGNPAAEYEVRSDQGTIEFTVRGAGKGMSWSFFPASGVLAQEYLKVLSLGACIGAGVRAEWPTANAFSAQAMALPPLVGSHDIEISPPSSPLTASAWGGEGRLLVAVHNGSTETQSATVEVAREALAASGVGREMQARSWVLAANAEPLKKGPAASIEAGRLRLAVTLEPGQALLWGSWGWE
ncbi:MAG: hypothetical protein FJX75_05290 [Armatimonadetes bacterium]|nr:hypothetical protein [Armatimonadota bacterium]